MGGRGRSSDRSLQITLEHELEKQEIQKIITLSHEKAIGTEGGFASAQLYIKCICCGSYMLLVDSKEEACDICGWINDDYQNTHPQSVSEPNDTCLEEYQKQHFEKKKNSN